MTQQSERMTEAQRRWLSDKAIYCFESDKIAQRLVAKGFIEFTDWYCASRREYRITDKGRAALSSGATTPPTIGE